MTSTATPRTSVRLSLEGMTCAACANRIERKLNRLDGVAAAVNFATEQASVDYDPSRAAVEDLIRAVEAAGYRAGVGARAAADVTLARPAPDPTRPRRRPERPARGARDGSPTPVRRVGVARTRARDPCRLVGRLAVPPRGRPERAPRRRHDGHADLDRHPRSLDLVRGRAPRARRRTHVLRGRSRDHDVDPARPLPRDRCPPTVGRRDPGPAGARGEGGARAPRRTGGGRPGRGDRDGRPLRRATGRDDSRRTA